MENASSIYLNLLLNVLVVGEEQLKMLEASLNGSTTQAENCKLVQETIRKAISVTQYFKSIESAGLLKSDHNRTVSDSPGSNSGSPRSEVSPRAFKEQERREMCKKRKTMPKWTQRVYLSPTGANGELDDSYSWRKYGQKDILGAKHPRGYYRCTYRNTAGCLAIKQMQRCDDNPLAFDITYRGEHTCQLHKSKQAATLPPNEQNMQQKQVNEQQTPNQSQQLLLSFQTNLKVETEELDRQESVTSFSFPLTPINSFTTPENNLFSTSSTPETNLVSNFSSPFISPATTSESNYFSLSGCGLNNYVGTSAVDNLESEFPEIMSALTSSSNSPFGDIGNFFDVSEFDTCYSAHDGAYGFGSLV